MARIDFAFGATDRLHMACQVIRKHYLAGRRLLVYADDAGLLERLDLMLWGFEPTAFIPHVYQDDDDADQTPILLTSSEPLATAGSTDAPPPWLVTLATNCPANAAQFERILEIVSQDSDDVLAARQRWVRYKADGHDLYAHDVSQRA